MITKTVWISENFKDELIDGLELLLTEHQHILVKDRVTAENVRLAHENGAVVNVWDVKTEEEANMLIGIGVDMITSDYKLK